MLLALPRWLEVYWTAPMLPVCVCVCVCVCVRVHMLMLTCTCKYVCV